MYRRKFPLRRRPRVPAGAPRPIGDVPRRQLQRAHRLMETGNHADAAAIFENLARAAHDRGMVRHAPHLYLQAARAGLLAGNAQHGGDLLRQGLKIFAQAERWPALARVSQRVVAELNQLGYNQLAAEISDWAGQTLPQPLEDYAHTSEEAARLPLKCPNCGGALRPNEVEMLDEITGECPYCGSAVREND